MKFAPPNEVQRETLRRNGIDPDRVCVLHEGDGCITFKNYKTGDEIRITENFEKQTRRKNGW